MKRYSAVCVLALTAGILAHTSAPRQPSQTPSASETTSALTRDVVIRSDLHMGLGKNQATGKWHATEDFRWPNAFRGFLDAISIEGRNRVDLVIAGDFLELWQPPNDVVCKGPNSSYGCTIDEMKEIAAAVIKAHSKELEALRSFSARGQNCLYIIPGNHDASLVIDSVWSLLADALNSEEGCVRRAENGIWVSHDGLVVAEHGHQIGEEPNKYKNWPNITASIDGVTYIERPWGERFVQKLYNEQERMYPLIDNLSPSSAGVRYRATDRGFFGSAADLGKFLRFNLLETSLRQKVQILGEPEVGEEWSVKKGRQLGHKLFLGALDQKDPFAAELRSSPGEWQELRTELDRLAQDLSDDEVLALCDQLAIRGADDSCAETRLGSASSRLLFSRTRVVKKHVRERWKKQKGVRVFVYGHTHSFEKEWQAKVAGAVSVTVLNSGAFQRVIDDAAFLRLAEERQISPSQLLQSHSLEELPPCYTSVHVTRKGGKLVRELRAWHMPEDGVGEFKDPCCSECADVGHGCY